MKHKYNEILNRVDIFAANHGHSRDVVLRNCKGKEQYSTMFARNKRARLIENIALSLELCAELAKYKSLNLVELAENIKHSISSYNKANVNVVKRADDIKRYCLDVAEDMNVDLLFNAYGLFDLYYNYTEEEIAIAFNFLCDKISVYKFKYNDLLPEFSLVYNKGKEQ